MKKQNAATAAPVAEDNSQSKGKGWTAATIIACVVAACGVGVGVYGMLRSLQKDGQISNLSDMVAQRDTTIAYLNNYAHQGNAVVEPSSGMQTGIITDSPRIAKIESSAQDDNNVRAIVYEMQKVVGEADDIVFVRIFDRYPPIAKNQDAKTYLSLERSYGLRVWRESGGADDSTAVAEAIDRKLRELGFVDDDGMSDDSFLSTYYGRHLINYDSGIVCRFTYTNLPFDVTCGHVSWISDESVAIASELADAYYAANGRYPFDISLLFDTNSWGVAIKDSSVAPYQTIDVGITNAGASFYRTSPDADWQYFTTAQGPANCAEFDTQDLKNAFAGTFCYDGIGLDAKDSTVQP